MLVQRRSRAVALLLPAVAVAIAGCAQPAEREQGAVAAVHRLAVAVAAGDGPAMCETLAPQTRATVAESGERTCAEAITEQDLPVPGAVTTTDVYGQWARVVTAGDTLFLAWFGDGWRVVAAGCRSRGEELPYDCRVQGE